MNPSKIVRAALCTLVATCFACDGAAMGSAGGTGDETGDTTETGEPEMAATIGALEVFNPETVRSEAIVGALVCVRDYPAAGCTETDSMGTYVFEAVPEGALVLSVSHPDFPPHIVQRLSYGQTHVQLLPTETLEAYVVAAGGALRPDRGYVASRVNGVAPATTQSGVIPHLAPSVGSSGPVFLNDQFEVDLEMDETGGNGLYGWFDLEPGTLQLELSHEHLACTHPLAPADGPGDGPVDVIIEAGAVTVMLNGACG